MLIKVCGIFSPLLWFGTLTLHHGAPFRLPRNTYSKMPIPTPHTTTLPFLQASAPYTNTQNQQLFLTIFDHFWCFWPSWRGSTTVAFLADSKAHDGPSSLLTKKRKHVFSLKHAYHLSLPFLPPPSQSYTNRPLWVRASLTSHYY